MHFQDVILTLQRYWGEQGCVLLQPHDMMMGAGTFHPATVLRSLGPSAWNCAYVQPSRRPGDARYGENPNRLGHYYQYQVIMKPSPADIQDLYLGSLEAIGIDLAANDVRFVEDNWESPTLGAWGLGWEVWLNGLEVSQFTYFQQVGGVACSPVPAEITYGLERLTMALQKVDRVYDLTWVDGVTYGDVFHRNEVEQSKYNFEHADVPTLFELFNRSFAECGRLCDLELPLPAYDQAIATSHAFNLLDARGAISVAERAQYIRRIRELACRCAEVWAASQPDAPAAPGRAKTLAAPQVPPEVERGAVFVEVVCEELPARFVRSTLAALRDGVVGLLGETEHGDVRTYATPRRLAVAIDDVAAARPRSEKLVTGPPADRSFKDGVPTRAAIGFARGKGIDPAALEIVDGKKGKVIAARVVEGGERTVDLLRAGLGAVITGIAFPKSMEWGSGGLRWARPIHRVNALFAGTCVGGEAAGVAVGATTVGHRLATDGEFDFVDEASWLAGLRERWVEPDLEVRRATITQQLAEASAAEGADPVDEPDLLEEVLHLVEAPTLVVGAFDEELLALPSRLLIETMKHHQRYFPLTRQGALTNRFVTISNNPGGHGETVAAGNAAVIRARFDDAKFFLAEDKKQPLSAYTPELARMRWIRGLGTMAAKQARVAELASTLAPRVGADPEVARRAGELCKADLVTQMVGEFPELQGHMGRLYAAAGGESDEVAAAIEEHYHPRFADDEVADSAAGAAVALADRLDTLVGCFAVGMQPKGGDPQGLRRAALGVVNTLVERGVRLQLTELVEAAVDALHAAVVASPEGFERYTKARGMESTPTGRDALVAELVDFVQARFRAAQVGAGASGDLVDAVLAAPGDDLVVLRAKVDALKSIAGHDEFVRIMQTFKRVLNITRDASDPAPARDALTLDAERALFDAIDAAEGDIRAALAELDFDAALARILTLQAPVAGFFDDVMVESDDPAERAVRKGLLLRVGRLFLGLADFSRISTR